MWKGFATVLPSVLFMVAPTSLLAEESTPKIEAIEMHLEAGAEFFQPWPSGRTIHSGVGWILPYGRADYWCGTDYAEAEAASRSQPEMQWILENSIDSNPPFCIYRTSSGDIYSIDVLVGTIEPLDEGGGRIDSVVNYVVGGTGAFAEATGVWVGRTLGRGQMQSVDDQLELPDSILKIMNGYVRTP
ncbi:MAG: hypothetical protein KC594_18155 [Nitrospira sp.]|nr:hypothetical protein [Nitrospira sp.]